jgi:hypothetical protein
MRIDVKTPGNLPKHRFWLVLSDSTVPRSELWPFLLCINHTGRVVMVEGLLGRVSAEAGVDCLANRVRKLSYCEYEKFKRAHMLRQG